TLGLLILFRWLLLIPVVALLIGSAYFTYVAAYEVYKGLQVSSLEKGLVLMIHAVDASLLAAVLLLFALGLYELFLAPLEVPEDHPFRRVLVVESLEDLKAKLAAVILMLLVVRFFEQAQGLHASSFGDLALLALGVSLLAFGLWISKKSG
ncbi:MAG: YqhA family protein, partial [Thermaceae bacterium]